VTEPRTITGKAWLSGTRPYVRRALAATILGIEEEATASCRAALAAADSVLAALTALDADGSSDRESMRDLIERAEAARRLAAPLLVPVDGRS
jgi:hypothetical protein